MSHTASARPTTRRALRNTLLALVFVAVAVIEILVYQSASASTPMFGDALTHDAPPESAPSSGPSSSDAPRGGRGGATTGDDGALPAGVTVFGDEYPGVANLDPDLLHALRDAATDAQDDGVELFVNSGWRSADYQDRLLREARSDYGSAAEAARWVATADTSPHVSGNAVDIELGDGTAWLAKRGAGYGLCQIYRNEPWHYELRPKAINRGCPRMFADPTDDPRMQP